MKKIVGFVLIYFFTSFLFVATPNTGLNGSLLHVGWLQWKNAMEGPGQMLADLIKHRELVKMFPRSEKK